MLQPAALPSKAFPCFSWRQQFAPGKEEPARESHHAQVQPIGQASHARRNSRMVCGAQHCRARYPWTFTAPSCPSILPPSASPNMLRPATVPSEAVSSVYGASTSRPSKERTSKRITHTQVRPIGLAFYVARRRSQICDSCKAPGRGRRARPDSTSF